MPNYAFVGCEVPVKLGTTAPRDVSFPDKGVTAITCSTSDIPVNGSDRQFSGQNPVGVDGRHPPSAFVTHLDAMVVGVGHDDAVRVGHGDVVRVLQLALVLAARAKLPDEGTVRLEYLNF